MVQLHDLGRDDRLERRVRVGEVRQGGLGEQGAHVDGDEVRLRDNGK